MGNDAKGLLDKIEELGWSVEEEDTNEYRIGKFSPAGQDFSIVVEGDNAEDLKDSIHDAYENFDVSEETYLWLDETGHGKGGAPDEMEDVLKDMKACEKNILELHNALRYE